MKQPPYPAPDFDLLDQSGKRHALSDYRGSWLVLYFYPKDDTPDCTVEACSFRDGRDDIAEQTGAQIIGISMDSVESHAKFAAGQRLTFPLLSDPDHAVLSAYGAWGKTRFGKDGILRRTFLIDPESVVRKVYGRVIPEGHADTVLTDLAALKG